MYPIKTPLPKAKSPEIVKIGFSTAFMVIYSIVLVVLTVVIVVLILST